MGGREGDDAEAGCKSGPGVQVQAVTVDAAEQRRLQVPSGAPPSDRWKVEDVNTVNTWVGLETLALLCAA